MAKDFINIVEFGKAMAVAVDAVTDKNAKETTPLALWFSARAQLAIAQQLSVISGHLGKLVEMCEKQPSK